MKCYLSTGAGHAEDGSRYVSGFNEESAMSEVRRILAETEPSGGMVSKDAWFQCCGAEDALAEALRSFVEGN